MYKDGKKVKRQYPWKQVWLDPKTLDIGPKKGGEGLLPSREFILEKTNGG